MSDPSSKTTRRFEAPAITPEQAETIAEKKRKDDQKRELTQAFMDVYYLAAEYQNRVNTAPRAGGHSPLLLDELVLRQEWANAFQSCETKARVEQIRGALHISSLLAVLGTDPGSLRFCEGMGEKNDFHALLTVKHFDYYRERMEHPLRVKGKEAMQLAPLSGLNCGTVESLTTNSLLPLLDAGLKRLQHAAQGMDPRNAAKELHHAVRQNIGAVKTVSYGHWGAGHRAGFTK